MEDIEARPRWITEYNYSSRQVCLTLAGSGPIGHHWAGIRKDDALSDPGGAFDIFVAFDGTTDGLGGNSQIVKVVAELNDEGDFKNPHPDFDKYSIGSLTIWPYKVAGERFELAHWMWWESGPIFHGEPRSWEQATRAG